MYQESIISFMPMFALVPSIVLVTLSKNQHKRNKAKTAH